MNSSREKKIRTCCTSGHVHEKDLNLTGERAQRVVDEELHVDERDHGALLPERKKEEENQLARLWWPDKNSKNTRTEQKQQPVVQPWWMALGGRCTLERTARRCAQANMSGIKTAREESKKKGDRDEAPVVTDVRRGVVATDPESRPAKTAARRLGSVSTSKPKKVLRIDRVEHGITQEKQ